MKKVYWRPTRVPRIILIVISFLAIAGMLSIELFKVKRKQPYYDQKIQAARKAAPKKTAEAPVYNLII